MGRSTEPELDAACQCEPEQATPHVSRKRQAAGSAREENASAAEPNHGPEETETYRGLQKCMGKAVFRPLPVGVEMLISGPHDTMKEMTTSGADGQRAITVSESYREELRGGMAGGAKGLVTHLAARNFGVSDGDVARCVTECGDGENPKKN